MNCRGGANVCLGFNAPTINGQNMKTTCTLTRLIVPAATAMLTLSVTQAQFIVYDDFSDPNVTAAKWGAVGGSSFPTVAGGTATFDGSDFIRSLDVFPIGTTLRFTVSSVQGGAVILGTTSQNNFGGFASEDSL